MNIVLIILSIAAFSATSISTRAFQLKCSKSKRDICLFQSLFCFVGAAAYFIKAGMRLQLSAAHLVMAMLFGVFFASASLFSAFCYEIGPMSLTSVIENSSVIIPVVYSCMLLNENVTLFQKIGFALLIATFVLSAFQGGSDDNRKKAGFLWFVFVLIGFFSNGITAVLQKQYKLAQPDADGSGFMGIAYLTAAVVLALAFALKRKDGSDENAESAFRLSPLCVLFVVCAGLGSFVGNAVLMRLSTELPAALLYPFVNGGLCVAVSIFSLAFFREKLTFSKACTIAVGITSIVFLNI